MSRADRRGQLHSFYLERPLMLLRLSVKLSRRSTESMGGRTMNLSKHQVFQVPDYPLIRQIVKLRVSQENWQHVARLFMQSQHARLSRLGMLFEAFLETFEKSCWPGIVHVSWRESLLRQQPLYQRLAMQPGLGHGVRHATHLKYPMAPVSYQALYSSRPANGLGSASMAATASLFSATAAASSPELAAGS